MTKILLASACLRDCSEVQVITIETAIGLRRRGHEVAIFGAQESELVELLGDTGIRMLGARKDSEWLPDVVHSSYVFQSLELAALYPHVPQVFVCHDSQGWHSAPPRLSLVRSWGAVDNVCADRIRQESLDPNAEVEWVANALDLDQFPGRGVLPPRPARVAVFADKSAHLPALREACQTWFLPLDEFGAVANRDVADAGETLGSYDVVVATSRRALEALASGCAVILADHRGFAGLVTEENVEAWRRANFGRELLTEATTASWLVDAIRSYDSASAARTSRWVRERVGINAYLDQLERMYEAAVRAERGAPTPIAKTLYESTDAHRRAFAAKEFGVNRPGTVEEVCESLAFAEDERTLMNRQVEVSDGALKKALHVERQMHQRLRQLSSNVKRLENEIGALKRKAGPASNVPNDVRHTVVGKWWRWKWNKKSEPNAFQDDEP